MSTPVLVTVQDGTPTTTSVAIAEGTGNEHRAVLQLIRNNLDDFSEFERVAFEMRPFETAGGVQHREVAVLTEEHATLLLTYMRNSAVVRDFKKRLVREFWELRRRAVPALAGPELIAAALIESQKMLEAREVRIHQLDSARAIDAPKVSYVDTYVTDTDLLSFSTVASTNNITEKRLRELLVEHDWIFVQTDSRWSEAKCKKVERRRYSEKADKKRYFRRVETHEAPRFRASEVMHTLKITAAGAEAIARLVAKHQT
ncbi:phage regulatory protein/antirepressor Ant [Mycobacterium sp. NPDC050853]|uniref:Rha family transcriptional regulator n=1 Tax=Mycobacterium sp. NPDC050853 TaxID=3155160 RepID=UPI0033D2E8A5